MVKVDFKKPRAIEYPVFADDRGVFAPFINGLKEIVSGSVTIKQVVREPGTRAKIAVYSETTGIDPVGSCVGQKGVRIQAVIDGLDGLEKIDVIQWSPDPVKYITNALSPAKNLKVELNTETKTARVTAPREELPLIIGREGQNVRLASKLTEYTIEVEGEEAPAVEVPEVSKVSEAASETVEEPEVEGTHEKVEAVGSEGKKPKAKKSKKTKTAKNSAEPASEDDVPEVMTEEPVSASPMEAERETIVEPQAPEDTKPEAASVLPKRDSGEPK